MATYKKPENVESPRLRWSLTRVLKEGSEGSYAIAIGIWDKSPALAIRWNGTKESPTGTPQSRGLPTWFIIPKDLEAPILDTLPEDEKKLAQILLNS